MLRALGTRVNKSYKRQVRSLPYYLLIAATLISLITPGFINRRADAMSGSQGPLTATSSANCVNLTGVGTIAWGTPANAQTSNTVYSTATITSTATTNYLKCTGFGFTLPAAGVTVAGITASITRKAATAARLADSTVSIVKGGVVTGNNKALVATWTTANTAFSYGAANDLWGTTWTAADINAATFGLVISVKNNTTTSTVASIDSLILSVAYNFNATFTQSTYRWFNNADSTAPVDVGTPLNGVAQNTATTALAEQSIIRLRLGIHVATDVAPSGAGIALKLQYAARGSDNTCDTAFANETYADVTTATPIAFANNPLATDGTAAKANAADPLHNADTKVMQDYSEANNTGILTTIPAGQDGIWDFALTDNAAPSNATFCFRIVDGAGGLLNTYTVIPQITTLPLQFNQAGYRWFNNAGSGANSTYATTWGAGPGDFAYTVAPTADGGYVAAGDDYSFGAGGSDAVILKYDSAGVLQWSRTWGGTGGEQGTSVTQTTDGGYIMGGFTSSYGSGGNDGYIAKFDASGTLLWSRVWGGSSDDYTYTVAETSDGGCIVTGSSNSASMGGFGGYDAILLKYDSAGTLSWKKAWGGTGDDYGQGVVQTNDGGYAMSGNTNSWLANYDPFITKFTSAGALTWGFTVVGSGFEDCVSVIQTSDGGYAITGNSATWPNTTSGDNMYVIKFTSAGAVSWIRAWGGPGGNTGAENGKMLVETTDTGIVVAGSTFTFGAGSDDFLIAKYSATGTLTWNKTWGGTLTDFGKAVTAASDGGVVVAGLSYSYAAGDGDIAMLKFASDGTIAGCSSPMCQSPAPTTSSPAVASTARAVTLKDVTPTTSSPTATSTDPNLPARFLLSTKIDVGAPLNSVAGNASVTAHDSAQTFRLRMLLHDSNKPSPVASQSFKLQYSQRGADGVCDTNFVNETYADVTAATPIAYADNGAAVDSQLALANANDPTHASDTRIMQEYSENNSYFTPNITTNPNAMTAGQDGVWDFALKENGAPLSTAYCLRMVYATGTPLTTYSVIPQYITSIPLSKQLRGGQGVNNGTKNEFYW